jgi:hypothetical protein
MVAALLPVSASSSVRLGHATLNLARNRMRFQRASPQSPSPRPLPGSNDFRLAACRSSRSGSKRAVNGWRPSYRTERRDACLTRASTGHEAFTVRRPCGSRVAVAGCRAPRRRLDVGAFTGRTRLTGQGGSGLRLAAWRAVWGAQRANPAYLARYQHLTSMEQNKLKPAKAQTVIAGAILRHLNAVITTG